MHWIPWPSKCRRVSRAPSREVLACRATRYPWRAKCSATVRPTRFAPLPVTQTVGREFKSDRSKWEDPCESERGTAVTRKVPWGLKARGWRGCLDGKSSKTPRGRCSIAVRGRNHSKMARKEFCDLLGISKFDPSEGGRRFLAIHLPRGYDIRIQNSANAHPFPLFELKFLTASSMQLSSIIHYGTWKHPTRT